jgi:PTH1 family peptidyl-tRNA hydrolase
VYAIFGLGNPGGSYSMNRHNVGFMLIDRMAAQKKGSFSPGKGPFYYHESRRFGKSVVLIKPTTYMNRSGVAVKHALRFFDIELENMIVLYDDFHLDLGMLRFRKRGSDGGHNGIKSIIYQLESETFNRLRFGIGDPSRNSVDHVLSDFKKTEEEHLELLFDKAVEGVDVWLQSGIDEAMNKFNRNFLN